jgi:hypothetical protein
MIRVVLDTNILVSALLQPQGVPARTFLTTLLLFTRTHGANTVLPFYFGWNIGACDLPLGCRRGSGAESPRHPEFSSATLNTSAPQPARRRPPLVNYVVSVAAEIQRGWVLLYRHNINALHCIQLWRGDANLLRESLEAVQQAAASGARLTRIFAQSEVHRLIAIASTPKEQ